MFSLSAPLLVPHYAKHTKWAFSKNISNVNLAVYFECLSVVRLGIKVLRTVLCTGFIFLFGNPNLTDVL